MGLLLVNSNSAAAVAQNAIIPLGSAVHGCGKGIRLNGNAITISERGYYNFSANASVAVTGTGEASIQLYKNGVVVPGAIATATPGAAGAIVNLTLNWLIRKSCCCDSEDYTIVLTAAGTVNTITTYIEKV